VGGQGKALLFLFYGELSAEGYSVDLAVEDGQAHKHQGLNRKRLKLKRKVRSDKRKGGCLLRVLRAAASQKADLEEYRRLLLSLISHIQRMGMEIRHKTTTNRKPTRRDAEYIRRCACTRGCVFVFCVAS